MSLRVLTWHVHGGYLGYMAECGHDIFVPMLPGRPPRFGGRPDNATWPDNVIEIPAERIARERFDVVLYQRFENWRKDRFEWMTPDQRALPQAFLEHDPPQGHPTDTHHYVDDPHVPIVHVTHYNQLMWDCDENPTLVIEHGVRIPDDVVWSGERQRGITAVNNLGGRGRRLGPDVWHRVRRSVPIDLVGVGSEDFGGRGEIAPRRLPYEMAHYRFFFNPIRYTSLGLAVCEALCVGLPVIGLATTEMAVAVRDGEWGFVDTDVDRLIEVALELCWDRALAEQLSANAREYGRRRFDIGRFARQWRVFLEELATGDTQRAIDATIGSAELTGVA